MFRIIKRARAEVMRVQHFRKLVAQVTALHALPEDEILPISRFCRALEFSKLLDAIHDEWHGDTRYQKMRSHIEDIMR